MAIRRTTIIGLAVALWVTTLPVWGQVLSTTAKRVGNRRVRIYAGPMWVRPKGVWVPITNAVSITQDGSAWVVAYDGKWIRLEPATPLIVKRVILEGKRFGPVLDKATAPDSVQFNITTSAGVTAKGDGWAFDGVPDDVHLGVFIHDWQQLLGDKLTMTASNAVLDLKAVKATVGTEINLDPTITATTDSGFIGAYDTDYTNCHAGLLPMAFTNTDIIGSASFSVPNYNINRGGMRFDTSGLDPLSAASFRGKTKTCWPVACNVRLARFDVDYGTWNTNDWAAATTTEADFTLVTTNTWNTQAVSHAAINLSGHTCYSLREKDHDVDFTIPATGFGGSLYGPNSGGNEPYLELTEAPAVPANPAIIDFGRYHQDDETAIVTWP